MSCLLQVHQCGCLAQGAGKARRAPLRRWPAGLCRAQRAGLQEPEESKRGQLALAGLAASVLMLTSQPCSARPSLPPIDRDPNRCERAYVGNTIGQANAVANKILDLRKCNYAGADLSKKVLAGALLVDTDLSNAKLIEAVLTKAYAEGSNFSGADMTNAVVDRVDFNKADLTNAKFKNTVVTGSTFQGANLDGAVFEDALIGREDVKKLCLNPTLKGTGREEVGCRT